MIRISTFIVAAIATMGAASNTLRAQTAQPIDVNIPILVPITGFLSLEGKSQRNGALLAVKNAPPQMRIRAEVADTGAAPEGAVNALERAASRGPVTAVVASMLGTQMLAMLPVAKEHRLPLVTVSGTAEITRLNNPYVFRFFPGDEVTKVAHVRYAIEELGKRRIALIYQTTAYGQSGRRQIIENLKAHGLAPVFDEGIEVQIRDMLPVLSKARAANPDVLFIHLHSGPTALLIRQAAAMGLRLPIVAGSAMHQPPTAELLEPGELAGVCAESNASPVSGGSPGIERFVRQYREEFNAEPDGFALGQYDGVMMVLDAIAKGARSAEDVTRALSVGRYEGLAMTYRSDGTGNMAHSAVIVCFDGKSRVPSIAKRYDNITGVLTN
ncbi:MAG TPA: ABC transporter substrate-binding protein [Alphaproteobacteria bacterium]|nr:ABC transporter substrate-binding protein [Alphaproteobacteria bacterium]